jgi:hypothetical protein
LDATEAVAGDPGPGDEAVAGDPAPEAADLPADATDATPDVADTPAEATDLPTDEGVEAAVPCPPTAITDETLDLLPDLPDTQIHAVLAFDGTAIWMAFDVPASDGSGNFETWAARLWCDGSHAVAPFRVGTTTRGNEIEPDLAVGDGNLYVAWEVDTGGNPNLFVVYRTFSIDGTPVMATDRLLETRAGGAPAAASAWMPRLAALPGGRFAIAGSWAPPTATRFQAFVVAVEADGDLAPGPGGPPPDTFEPYPEPGVSQTFPALASAADGTLFAAWNRTEDEGADRVVHVSIDPAMQVVTPLPPAFASAIKTSAAPALVAVPGSPAQAVLALHAGETPDVVVRTAVPADFSILGASFGASGKADHTPAVAPGPGGGAVAWYRMRSGIRNDLYVQGFALDGATVTAAGSPLLLNPPDVYEDHAAAPYQTTIAHVGGGVYFLAWSEGKSPAFRIKGRFVKP